MRLCKLIHCSACVTARANSCVVAGCWSAVTSQSGARRLPADAYRFFTLKNGWQLIKAFICAVHVTMLRRVRDCRKAPHAVRRVTHTLCRRATRKPPAPARPLALQT